MKRKDALVMFVAPAAVSNVFKEYFDAKEQMNAAALKLDAARHVLRMRLLDNYGCGTKVLFAAFHFTAWVYFSVTRACTYTTKKKAFRGWKLVTRKMTKGEELVLQEK